MLHPVVGHISRLNPSFGGIWCRVGGCSPPWEKARSVLILLLVEYGIGYDQYCQCLGGCARRLNPSFGGIWYRVAGDYGQRNEHVFVLILLLVEYGVGYNKDNCYEQIVKS